MPLSIFEDIEANVPEISAKAKYWFVRTDGGNLYPAFIASNTIAMGYGAVGISFIESLPRSESSKELPESSKELLKAEIKRHYPPKEDEDGQISDLSGLHASQLWRFCAEIKRGDIVLVPSKRTERLSIGIVNDDVPFDEVLTHEGEAFSEFRKRRKVRWVRAIERASVNPNLFALLLNHQTISDASPYSEWIDALLYEFFNKGGSFHYVLKVRTRENIRAQALFGACLDLFVLAEDFAKSEQIDFDTEDIKTRINLNSPGAVELWMAGVAAATLISLLVVLINGGGLDISLKKLDFKLGLKTEGLITNLTNFLNARENRKTVEAVRKKLENLQVETPQQMIDLLKATKK